MNETAHPKGWQIHHHEQLFFRANSGAPTIRLKFFHYPSYRQTIILNQPPRGCKLKTKRNNTFFLFTQKVRTKGAISLERIVSIYPIPSVMPEHTTWGRITDIPRLLQRKYKQSYSYWPLHSQLLQNVSQEHWFATDDVSTWVHGAYSCITLKIKYPGKQDKRLGADQALRTGSGDCDEFTDLFITLARLRGVPCRRLTGYYIDPKTNQAEPHAWAELLSPTLGWIPIDISLRNLGRHTTSYVVGKIEEFTPLLLDYHIVRRTSVVHYRWDLSMPQITPLY